MGSSGIVVDTDIIIDYLKKRQPAGGDKPLHYEEITGIFSAKNGEKQ